jgi:hypothetical protein
VLATASQGQVVGQAASSSVLGKVTSVAQARASFDDVVFTFGGPGQPPSVVPSAVFNFEVAMSQSASGPLGSLGSFNAREMIWSAAFMGVGTGGRVVFDVTGNTGQDQLRSHQLQAVNVPIDAPVTISFDVFVSTQATSFQSGISVSTGAAGVISLDAAQVQPRLFDAQGVAGSAQGPLVFDLPPGFTVNSPSMGIVDNRWIFASVVPESSTQALMACGLLLVAAAVPRRRRATG